MNKVTKLLLNYKDYTKLAAAGLLERPHIFTIKYPHQLLFYYGATHSTDPKHPQYKSIKLHWLEWIAKTRNMPRLAMVEGGVSSSRGSHYRSIVNRGENGYLTYLSSLAKIKVASPEPDRQEVDKYLLKNFSRDEIQFYYFARVVWQYSARFTQEDFNKYVSKFLGRDKTTSGWNDYDFSLRRMNELCRKITGRPIEKYNTDFWYDLINPTNKKSLIYSLVIKQSDVRDAVIVKNISNEWNKGKSLFILYGFSHAYRQEAALKKLLQPRKSV